MAGNAIVGALRVVLGADTAAFESGLKSAQSKMDSFGAGMAKAGAAIGVAMAAAAASLAVSIKHAVDEADKLGKMAQKVGVPVEELSALKHAADLSGVSLEALGTGLGKLSKAMVEAAAKPTSEAANAFRALGVSATNADGTLKSSSQVLSDVAGKFEGLKDGAGKTAVAMAIFGKSGKDMIPLLNAGRDGLQEMKDEAEKLGIIISGKTFKSAEAFNDNLTRLGKAKDGIILKITEGLLPSLENLTNKMVAGAKESNSFRLVGETLGAAFTFLTNVGAVLAGKFAEILLSVTSLGKAAFALATGDFAKISEIFTTWTVEAGRLKQSTNEAAKSLVGLNDPLQQISVWAGEGAFGKIIPQQKEFNYQALAGKTAIDKFVEATKKSIAAQDAETQTVGMAAGAKENLKVQLQGLEVATAAQIRINDALRIKLAELGFSAEQSALKLQGVQLVQQNLAPGELFRTEMENNRLAMVAVGATSEQLARQAEKDAEKFGMSWSAIGTNIAGTAGALSQLAGTFSKENKAMGIASKAFGIGQAIINTQIAITKALATLPPPASYAAVALAIAQGAAAVATISAQGFARGGSFMVPGGKSMTDNMMVPLNLASGERVDITPANDVGRGGRGGNTVIELHGERFSRDQVRDLFETINSGLADGHRFKVA
jgi:hypothetical protein